MKRLFYLLFCISLLGCGENSAKKPVNAIPEDKMVRILADIATLEARVERRILYPDTALMTFSHYEKEILKNYDVDEQQFRETWRFYLQNIPEMDRVYEIVIDTLSLREAKLTSGAATADTTNIPSRAPLTPGGEVQ